MNDALWRVFERTTYGTPDARFELGAAPKGAPSWASGPWGIVTAWNPRGARTDVAANEAAQLDLRRSVEALGLPVIEGVNGEGEWEEPSLIVLGVSLRAARELGARFDQAAIVWGHGRRAAIVACRGRGVHCGWVRSLL